MAGGKNSNTPRRDAGLMGRKPKPAAGRRRAARHLFGSWRQVAERLKSANRLALFLDFDGTLVALRPRPEDVRLDPTTRRVLKRLAGRARVKVWIISGRRCAEVRRRAKIPGVRYLGLHGWERSGRRRFPGDARARIEAASHLLSGGLASFPNFWIEDKGLCLVLHFRRAPAKEVRRARPLVRAILRAFEKDLRLMNGNKIWEVLSKEVKGKGEAVRAVLAEFPDPPVPVYVGDDTTDEAAFAALRRGITVRVGKPRATRAHFFLRNLGEVRQFLERLEAEIG
ncbi:MAG: trehalose-phosphatase [Acidobacteria bacterium]|nr:trehalose-phosphatase [Acidobacteriota bacterium]